MEPCLRPSLPLPPFANFLWMAISSLQTPAIDIAMDAPHVDGADVVSSDGLMTEEEHLKRKQETLETFRQILVTRLLAAQSVMQRRARTAPKTSETVGLLSSSLLLEGTPTDAEAPKRRRSTLKPLSTSTTSLPPGGEEDSSSAIHKFPVVGSLHQEHLGVLLSPRDKATSPANQEAAPDIIRRVAAPDSPKCCFHQFFSAFAALAFPPNSKWRRAPL